MAGTRTYAEVKTQVLEVELFALLLKCLASGADSGLGYESDLQLPPLVVKHKNHDGF